MNKGRLAGKTALITGASRGIGRAIAERFAEEGADLFLSATGLAQLAETKAAAEAHGARVELCAADVSDQAQIEVLFEQTLAAYPDLDIVVNNAGIYASSPFVEFTPEQFDKVMKTNTYSVFTSMQLATRHMLAQGGGKIVNIASTAGKWESPNQAIYNASKHAVVGLTRCVALETASKGININAICPGLVATDMVTNFGGLSSEQVAAMAAARVPIGRLLDPIEIAHIAVYLASNESDGMTGQTITIAGGMRMG
jgi:meso-butanediol dehydrogenase / (S,S)-butanediol dehydrogenase / diacetyl reductase